jgi:predicted nucleic acid-binding protein
MAAGRVVLDTDVASRLWRGRLTQYEEQRLVGHTPVLTFVAIAELWQGAHHAGWGLQRVRHMQDFYGRFMLLHCNFEVVMTWGRLAGQAMRGGVTVPHNDCWVAACCVAEHVPLLTGNQRHFQPLVDLNLGLALA